MQRSWLPRTLVLSAVLLAAACAKPSSEEPPPATSADRWCEGAAVLMVRNNSGGDVEIRESRLGSGARVVIATLGPGHYREISIRGEKGYTYSSRLVGSSTVLSATSRTRVWDTVTLHRECRER